MGDNRGMRPEPNFLGVSLSGGGWLLLAALVALLAAFAAGWAMAGLAARGRLAAADALLDERSQSLERITEQRDAARADAQGLAERGFAVWKMDNRGSARRGVAFESAIHRAMGTVEVRDQVDGVRFVAGKHPDLVDPKRVGVTGSSYGGYMTLRCLTEAPDVFHAGVSLAPVTDWDGYDTCYTERYMGTPRDNPEGYKAASVLTRADALVGKLFVVHGTVRRRAAAVRRRASAFSRSRRCGCASASSSSTPSC